MKATKKLFYATKFEFETFSPIKYLSDLLTTINDPCRRA